MYSIVLGSVVSTYQNYFFKNIRRFHWRCTLSTTSRNVDLLLSTSIAPDVENVFLCLLAVLFDFQACLDIHVYTSLYVWNDPAFR